MARPRSSSHNLSHSIITKIFSASVFPDYVLLRSFLGVAALACLGPLFLFCGWLCVGLPPWRVILRGRARACPEPSALFPSGRHCPSRHAWLSATMSFPPGSARYPRAADHREGGAATPRPPALLASRARRTQTPNAHTAHTPNLTMINF